MSFYRSFHFLSLKTNLIKVRYILCNVAAKFLQNLWIVLQNDLKIWLSLLSNMASENNTESIGYLVTRKSLHTETNVAAKKLSFTKILRFTVMVYSACQNSCKCVERFSDLQRESFIFWMPKKSQGYLLYSTKIRFVCPLHSLFLSYNCFSAYHIWRKSKNTLFPPYSVFSPTCERPTGCTLEKLYQTL